MKRFVMRQAGRRQLRSPVNSGSGYDQYLPGLELGEYKKYGGYCNYCTYDDSQRYHIALVLPIGYFTGRATTAKESMRIHFLTVTARSCDGAKHS